MNHVFIVQDKGISAFPDGDNLLSWVGTVEGPQVRLRQQFKTILKLLWNLRSFTIGCDSQVKVVDWFVTGRNFETVGQQVPVGTVPSWNKWRCSLGIQNIYGTGTYCSTSVVNPIFCSDPTFRGNFGSDSGPDLIYQWRVSSKKKTASQILFLKKRFLKPRYRYRVCVNFFALQ